MACRPSSVAEACDKGRLGIAAARRREWWSRPRGKGRIESECPKRYGEHKHAMLGARRLAVLLAYLDESYDKQRTGRGACVPDEQLVQLTVACDAVIDNAAASYVDIGSNAELHGHSLSKPRTNGNR